jgi:hypothetical protein
MRKIAAVFVIVLGGAVALPTIDLSAQTSPPASPTAKKRGCDRYDPASAQYKDCKDRAAKNAEARRARQAACAQYKPKTQERKDCLAQQKRAAKTTTRPS